MQHGPPDVGGLISLKVDNFPFETTSEDLRQIFGEQPLPARRHRPPVSDGSAQSLNARSPSPMPARLFARLIP